MNREVPEDVDAQCTLRTVTVQDGVILEAERVDALRRTDIGTFERDVLPGSDKTVHPRRVRSECADSIRFEPQASVARCESPCAAGRNPRAPSRNASPVRSIWRRIWCRALDDAGLRGVVGR